jgi:aerobic-type carbon monoxide dehydrogenase small subunit (CoxS/CutS family)
MPRGDSDIEGVQRMAVRFEVNGSAYEAEVEPWRTLAELLRDGLVPGFKSVKPLQGLRGS